MKLFRNILQVFVEGTNKRDVSIEHGDPVDFELIMAAEASSYLCVTESFFPSGMSRQVVQKPDTQKKWTLWKMGAIYQIVSKRGCLRQQLSALGRA